MRRRSGQSLIEILVAVAVGTLMILGATTIIMPALRTNTDTARRQVAVALAKETLDAVRVFSESNWASFSALQSGTSYVLNSTSSPFSVTTGTESIVVGTTTYSRYFTVASTTRTDIYGVGNVGGSYPDPSSKLVTVYYRWPNSPTSSISTYVSRWKSNVMVQSDWSGGPTSTGPYTSPAATFSSSVNMNYSSSTGSIRIQL